MFIVIAWVLKFKVPPVHIHHSATTPNQVPWLRQDNPNFSSPAVSVTVAGTVSYAVTITQCGFCYRTPAAAVKTTKLVSLRQRGLWYDVNIPSYSSS